MGKTQRSGKTVSIVRLGYHDKYDEGYAVWAGNIEGLLFADWNIERPQYITSAAIVDWRKRYGGITIVIAEMATWFNAYNFKAESSQDFGLVVQQTSKGNVHLLYDTQRPNHSIKRLRDLTHYFVKCIRSGDPRDYTVPIQHVWCVPIKESELKPIFSEIIYPEDYGQYFQFYDTWKVVE